HILDKSPAYSFDHSRSNRFVHANPHKMTVFLNGLCESWIPAKKQQPSESNVAFRGVKGAVCSNAAPQLQAACLLQRDAGTSAFRTTRYQANKYRFENPVLFPLLVPEKCNADCQ